MSMGCTYKFFESSVSYTIFYLSLSTLCLLIMLLLPCTFPPLFLPPNPLPWNPSMWCPFLWFCSCSGCLLFWFNCSHLVRNWSLSFANLMIRSLGPQAKTQPSMSPVGYTHLQLVVKGLLVWGTGLLKPLLTMHSLTVVLLHHFFFHPQLLCPLMPFDKRPQLLRHLFPSRILYWLSKVVH